MLQNVTVLSGNLTKRAMQAAAPPQPLNCSLRNANSASGAVLAGAIGVELTAAESLKTSAAAGTGRMTFVL